MGVYCTDGVVIGTDSAATFAAGQVRTIEQRIKKIDIVSDRVIVAGTGEVGLGQRFHAIVEAGWKSGLFQRPPIEIGKLLSAEAIKDFGTTNAPRDFGALVAFPCKKRPYLLEFSPHAFQPELKTDRLWYVSMGSGQAIGDPFLGFIREVFWHDGIPSCREAVFAVTWTISQAIALNTGGVGGPVQIATISHKGGELVAEELSLGQIAEHEDNVRGAIQHLRTYRELLRGNAKSPELPQS